MKRITKISNDIYLVHKEHIFQLDDYFSGEAIEKLGKYETIQENLIKRQNKIIEEMEELKSLGKNKTVKFSQLLTEKISNNNILSIFEVYGL